MSENPPEKSNEATPTSESKPEEEPKIEPVTESPTPEPITEEEVVDVTKAPWKIYNQFIYYNSDTNQWYCLSCREMLESAKGAGLHATKKHGFQKKYRVDKPDGGSEEISTDDESVSRQASSELEKELFGASGQSSGKVGDTADLALRINADQEAKYVSELVKNPYVNYLYAKMKDQRLIFPDWALADFLREGALIFAASLGCYSDFGQNKEILKQNKHFGKIAISISRAWEEYDAEQEFEAAVGSEEKIG